MQTFTLSKIQSMLGLSRSVVAGLVAAGFVTPSRGSRNEYRFSFQDVVLLRTAYGLQSAHIAARQIVKSLQRLKATLPAELPLTGLRISAVGNEVAVREGSQQWAADSGQLLIDFEVNPVPGSVSVLNRKAASDVSAREWFARGEALEARDKHQAEQAYRESIRQKPAYLDPYLNLGVLLCDSRRDAEAVDLYREALLHLPAEAPLHFNLAIAYENLHRDAEALASYDACLHLEPSMADAHFNAALLHERLGHPKKAIRHFSAYRRLQG